VVTDGCLSATGELCATRDKGTAGGFEGTEDALSDPLSGLSCDAWDLLTSNSRKGFEMAHRDKKGFGLSADAPWNGFVGGRDLDSLGDNFEAVNGLMKGLLGCRTGAGESCGDLGDCAIGLMTSGDRHGVV
jgi:hypothetical protein